VSELEIPRTRKIREMLTLLGIWWIATGVSVKRKARGVRSGEPGQPDTLLPALGWLETKTEEGKLLPSQIAWHARAAREGVRVAIVHSPEEAARIALEWRREQ
jgi:hypothetical protein